MNKISAGSWRLHLIVLLAMMLLAAAIWWIYAFQPFEGLSPDSFGDSYDYAQIARNIARGSWREGITTFQIPPLALSVSDHVPFLNVIRAPLHPIALAAAFTLLGPWDRVIALYGGALFLLSVPLLYVLALRVFGAKAALAATLVYILSDWVLQISASGLSEPLYVVLFLAMLWAAYESNQQPDSRWLPLATGLLAGLGYLTRYNTILFVPLIAAYLWWAGGQRRWLAPALFAASCVLVASPWLIRNLVFFGQPLFSMQSWTMLMATPTYPRFVLWKQIPHPSVASFFLDHGSEMAAKIKDTFLAFYRHAPGDPSVHGGSPSTLLLFSASLFRSMNKGRGAFRILVCAMLAMQVLGLLPLRYIPRLLFPFYPLFLAFGLSLAVSCLEHGIRRIRSPRAGRWAQVGGLTLLVAFLTLPTLAKLPGALAQGFAPRLLPVRNLQVYGPDMRILQASTESDTILISDAMDIVSWYGDRACIWTPSSLEMVDLIEERVTIEGIYLTERMFAWPEDQVWHEIFRTRPEAILDGRYELQNVFDNGSLYYRRTP